MKLSPRRVVPAAAPSPLGPRGPQLRDFTVAIWFVTGVATTSLAMVRSGMNPSATASMVWSGLFCIASGIATALVSDRRLAQVDLVLRLIGMALIVKNITMGLERPYWMWFTPYLLVPVVLPAMFYRARHLTIVMASMFVAGGALAVLSPGPHTLRIASVATLCWIATMFVIVVQLQTRLRRDTLDALTTLASTDSLTGLANRRAFIERAEARIEAARASSVPFSLILADIDHFKRVNDSYGHHVGDDVLRIVGSAMAATFDGSRSVARIGGEEFAVDLVGHDLTQVSKLLDSLRTRLETVSSIPVTMSFGVVSSDGGHTMETLLQAADRALYKAKDRGRNTAVFEVLANSPTPATIEISNPPVSGTLAP